MIATTTRNATLADLGQLLQDQQARKIDMVVPARAVTAENSLLRITGADPVFDAAGVTTVDGLYRPTQVCDDGIASKLGIPQGYMRRLRNERPDLWDANVNGWLHGPEGDAADIIGGDPRKFLLRAFRGDEGDGEGIARAWLTNGYKLVDNLDILTAALDGARQAGTEITIGRCNLTETRMYVDVLAPGITALAPHLLKGYRNPLGGQLVGDEPVMYSGLRISNSEVGHGAATICPMAVVQICTNGMTCPLDRLRLVHVGARLDEGVINWSEETRREQLALTTSQSRDAVATFLSADYLNKVVAEIEAKAGAPLPKAPEKIETIGSTLGFSAEETAGVLDHFITSGTPTVGGLGNAITSFSQTLASADRAMEMDDTALRAMDLAVAANE
jgi:hypothetical protein